MAENQSISPWWLLLPAALVVICVAGVVADKTANAPSPPPNVTAGIPVEEAPEVTAPRKARGGNETGPEPSEPPKPEAKEIVSQWTTLESALSESRGNGKPVMIDFSAEWCGPCRRLKGELFDDLTAGRAVQTAVIPVSIVDRRREDGQNPPDIEGLQTRFQVDAFPTLVVFNPETGKSMKTQGFGDAERTLQWITAAAQAVR
jgi:thiol:disulfide interchange protein